MSVRVYNIDPGANFLRILARHILKNQDQLQETLVFLPTRRACRLLQQEFLDLTGGKAFIAPRLAPLGDIDEEELSLSLLNQDAHSVVETIPPAISSEKRRFLLMTLIRRLHDDNIQMPQALALADSLAQFMDQVIIEQRDLSALKNLVPEDFAEHWQITLNFLDILSIHWPKILEEHNVIDAAERRNRLMAALSEHWKHNQPQIRIIAAGSTGSVPASAKLMHVIARLPRGEVILPGFDQNLDENSFETLDETHPQFALKRLLSRLDISRDQVQPLIAEKNYREDIRATLLREVMRPAATSDQWKDLSLKGEGLKDALDDMYLSEHQSIQNEAMAVAIKMRHVLENPKNTCIFVTPDRQLAKTVSQICTRWGIIADDSAGDILLKKPKISYFFEIIDIFSQEITPFKLISFIKNEFFRLNYQKIDSFDEIENDFLRKLPKLKDFNEILLYLKNKEAPSDALNIFETLQRVSEPLMSQLQQKKSLDQWISIHLNVLQQLCSPEDFAQGDEIDNLINLLQNLSLSQDVLGEASIADYRDILLHHLNLQMVRPKYGTHPRLQILGQLEARLSHADVIILGGLNEGVWPRDPASDSFLSRPMRNDFGLTAMEYQIGLSAHDFSQLCGAKEVYMTRSKMREHAPTNPSRWLVRLQAVMKASHSEKSLLHHPSLSHWASQIDHSNKEIMIKRPQPKPPVRVRPQKLSVTKIETWMKNPYAIYAQYILKLKKLDPIEIGHDAALRGQFFHGVFEDFVKDHKLSNSAYEALEKIAKKRDIFDLLNTPFQYAHFKKISVAFLDHEKEWQKHAKPLSVEARGNYTLANLDFTLSGIADRIDQRDDGTLALIDYKTGGQFSQKKLYSGAFLQLPLEAAMLHGGGFSGLPEKKIGYIGYWVLSGGAQTLTISAIKDEDDIAALATLCMERLTTLIQAFKNEKTPYYATPHNAYALMYNDYAHLERQKEWGDMNGAEDAA